MYNYPRAIIMSYIVLFSLLMPALNGAHGADLGNAAKTLSVKTPKPYPRSKSLFTFGVWGIPSMRFQDYFSPLEVRFGDYGDQQPLRNLRKNYCNAILNPGAGPVNLKGDKKTWTLLGRDDKKYTYGEYLERLAKLSNKYKMYFAPLTGGAIPDYRQPVYKGLSKSDRILGWYLKDEPDSKWLNSFIKRKALVQNRNPRHPAFVLCCSEEQVKTYAPHSSLIVTDCYPLKKTILHKGKYLKRDPWEVVDWCKMVEANSSGRPHYLTLSCHSFWSDAYPTIAELRLQTYLGLAHGADGIYYFIYSYGPQWLYKYIEKTLFDPYGNPSELWKEVGSLGKKLLPIGETLMMSKVDSSVSLEITGTRSINTVRGPMDCIQGIVRVNPKGVRLVYLWNNDIQYQQMASFKLSPDNDRFLYDLMTWEKLGAPQKKRLLNLAPGEGRIFAVCNEDIFVKIRSRALRKEIENELIRFQIDLELAKLNGVNCSVIEDKYNQLMPNRAQTKTTVKLKDHLDDIISLQKQLSLLIQEDGEYVNGLNQMLRARQNLGRMHKILCEKLEAPRVVIGLGLPRPFAVLKQPGRSYGEQALLLSLAFKELSKRQANGKTRELEELARLVADETERFSDLCASELVKHKPLIASLTSDVGKKLIDIIGVQVWEYKKLWLERDNGVNQALQKRKAELDDDKKD